MNATKMGSKKLIKRIPHNSTERKGSKRSPGTVLPRLTPSDEGVVEEPPCMQQGKRKSDI